MGKSTLSCATALKLAERGSVLLVSVDPAHSLSGILGVKVGSEIKNISQGLHALELHAEKLVQAYAERVAGAIGEIVPSVRSGLQAYLPYLTNSPTALETAVLDRLVDFFHMFEFVVVDMAPTGQMLRLFRTANIVRGWFEFLHKVALERHKLEQFMGREDRVLDLILDRKVRLETLLSVLKERSVVFAVANEEPLSLQETSQIINSLSDMRVYPLLNRWTGMEWSGLKVSLYDKPYGIERLRKMDLEHVLRVLLSEPENPLP